MQTFTPATAWHGTPCVLINDDHLPVLNDVVDVFLEHGVCFQGRMHVVQQTQVTRRIKTVTFLQNTGIRQHFFYEFMTFFSQFNRTAFLIDKEMTVNWLAVVFGCFTLT